MTFNREKFFPKYIEDAHIQLGTISSNIQMLETYPENREPLDDLIRATHTIKGASRIMKQSGTADVAWGLEQLFRAVAMQQLPLDRSLFTVAWQGIEELQRLVAELSSGQAAPAPRPEVLTLLEQGAQGRFVGQTGLAIEPPAVHAVDSEHMALATESSSIDEENSLPEKPDCSIVTEVANNFPKEGKTRQFAIHCRDLLAQIDKALLRLEETPDDEELIHTIYRHVHSIKGGARIMNLPGLAQTAHHIEDVLQSLRERTVSFTSDLCDDLLVSTDVIKGQLEDIDVGRPMVEESTINSIKDSTSIPDTVSREDSHGDGLDRRSPEVEMLQISATQIDQLIRGIGEAVTLQNRLRQHVVGLKEMVVSFEKVLERFHPFQDSVTVISPPWRLAMDDASILRKDMIQLVSDIANDVELMMLLFSEINDDSVRMRMRSLSTLFDGLPRMTRDFARSRDKKVRMFVHGGDIRIDKTILAKIEAPLVQLVRNAIVHGIESPEERSRRDKPRMGTLRLDAKTQGRWVVVELTDDGRGISPRDIQVEAVRRGLASMEQLSGKSDHELMDLLFLPGFSTASSIDQDAGRGVGLDVVRKNVCDLLKGSVVVRSEPNKWTSFQLRFPITLATISMLLLAVDQWVFALPSGAVLEIRRVRDTELIDVVGSRAIRLQERVIPVMNLTTLLGFSSSPKKEDASNLMLLVSDGHEQLGLLADDVLDEEETVLKPLPFFLRTNPFLISILISGRNRIVHLLDPLALIRLGKSLRLRLLPPGTAKEAVVVKRILVVDDSLTTREIEKEILESSGYHVTVAIDGEDGYQKAMQIPFDLMITDIEMPRMDGFTLVERVRGEPLLRHFPIMIITSRGSLEDRERGLQVGADAYVVKDSFDQSYLVETVRNLIGA
ncbi:MAG: Hpt domain-containing protein [Nitrospirae bacterium]|nr:Hpt domain-containing protein [Magnetococcales bacterium]